MSDAVNHPQHYNVAGLEVINLIDQFFAQNYYLGNTVKYIFRAKHKGREQEDLSKAKWYLSRLLDQKQPSLNYLEGEHLYCDLLSSNCEPFAVCEERLTEYCKAFGVGPTLKRVLTDMLKLVHKETCRDWIAGVEFLQDAVDGLAVAVLVLDNKQ